VDGSRGRLEWQGAEDRLRGRLNALQRLTQGVRIAVVKLNVVSGVHARRMPIAVVTMNATASASASRTVFDAGRSSPRW
jgi:hypothetical protein